MGEDIKIGQGDHLLEKLDAKISAGCGRTSTCEDQQQNFWDDFAQTVNKPLTAASVKKLLQKKIHYSKVAFSVLHLFHKTSHTLYY